jgi:hypothetical protein
MITTKQVKNQVIMARIPTHLDNQIRRICVEKKITASSLIRQALQEHTAKN